VNEFTGERVIPGRVDDELWDEHIARYAFARRFAAGKCVLDLGCGTGYGTIGLGAAAELAVGIDSAADALPRARTDRAIFVQAPASALPFRAESFDLITAFEVIEHLADWDQMLAEARRVLRRTGVFIVSTPNRSYYAESRAKVGPNPFHVHEFEYAEFRDALARHFPYTTLFVQNRAEAFVFAPEQANRIETAGCARATPDDAQFFVAVCAIEPAPSYAAYLYLPTAANLLREREQHIRKLEGELALSKQWLAAITAERDQLLEKHTALTTHLEEQNRWAMGLETEWKTALARISQLQDEFQAEQAAARQMAAEYEGALSTARADSEQKAKWAIETEARLGEALSKKSDELAEAVRLLDRAESTVTERTVWAQKLQSQVEQLEAQLEMIRASRWLKLGRAMGLGPRVGER